MMLESLRQICRALPGATEDVKWGQDLCFCVGSKMFAAVNLEPPHQLGFKCSPEMFAELIEREGITPAPYLARAMWVQESELGSVLERRELEPLIRASYELVVAGPPKSKRPGAAPNPKAAEKSKPKPKTKARATAKTRARRPKRPGRRQR
jgi:predicted DNA-binding protein (MmcQ/YjbR family)